MKSVRGVRRWLPLLALPLAVAAQDEAPVLLTRNRTDVWSNVTELRRAAERGVPQACSQLGEMLLAGGEVETDVPRGLALLEKAARAGVAAAAFRVGMLLDEGRLVERDRRRAMGYFRAAAAGGVPEAFYNLGSAYAGAHGVARDYTEALAWLILAVKHGVGAEGEQKVRDRIAQLKRPEWIPAAEARAAAIEREFTERTVQSLLPPAAGMEALTQAQRAAGDTGGEISVRLPTGRRPDWSGRAALERAAERGDTVAMAALGQILLEGKAVPADPARALPLLERAARAGSADAAQLLAELHASGRHVARDDARAFAYNLQAARGGARLAMFNTAALYTSGRGTARDYKAALTWMILAREFGAQVAGAEWQVREHLNKIAPADLAAAEKNAAALKVEIEKTLSNPDRP